MYVPLISWYLLDISAVHPRLSSIPSTGDEEMYYEMYGETLQFLFNEIEHEQCNMKFRPMARGSHLIMTGYLELCNHIHPSLSEHHQTENLCAISTEEIRSRPKVTEAKQTLDARRGDRYEGSTSL